MRRAWRTVALVTATVALLLTGRVAVAEPGLAGANDWTCTPSASHPRPVVLVHGSGSDIHRAFPVLAVLLRAEGYCVFARNIGGVPAWYDPSKIVWGTADIRRSGEEFRSFVDEVRARTGATQVDVVGHSSGGTVARQYLKNGGAGAVASLVLVSSANNGTTFAGLRGLYPDLASLGMREDQIAGQVFGAAGTQMQVGSTLLADLDAGGQTIAGVRYTAIATRDDEVATPPETAFLAAADNVRNVWVQDGCPTNRVAHGSMLIDPRALHLVLAALDPDYGRTHTPPCAS
jgi:triacylglycerol esterase/lipase EstA (alpha/beta hydrolase family)